MRYIRSTYRLTSSMLAFGIMMVMVLGCEECGSRAKGKIVNSDCQSDAGFVNGEMDYGVTVKVTIRNVGQDGVIKIDPGISTSEGDWKRTQRYTFRAGEERTFTYFFSEPTIKVSNVQCKINIFPRSS